MADLMNNQPAFHTVQCRQIVRPLPAATAERTKGIPTRADSLRVIFGVDEGWYDAYWYGEQLETKPRRTADVAYRAWVSVRRWLAGWNARKDGSSLLITRVRRQAAPGWMMHRSGSNMEHDCISETVRWSPQCAGVRSRRPTLQRKLSSEPVLLVDVRQPEEFTAPPGSLPVRSTCRSVTWPATPPISPHVGQPIVVVCKTNRRSARPPPSCSPRACAMSLCCAVAPMAGDASGLDAEVIDRRQVTGLVQEFPTGGTMPGFCATLSVQRQCRR